MPWPAALVAFLGALMTAAVTPAVLRALPEPDLDPESDPDDAGGKPTWTSLSSPGFVVAVAAACLLCGLLATILTPPAHWLAWASLTTVNVLACAIDARTTWLPLPLARAGWALAGAGAVVVALDRASWWPLLAALLGAAALGGVFHLVWRFTRAFGYGDVRLAATIGAVTALDSPVLVAWSLLLGTTAGALVGVAHRLAGGRGAFPYGPGLLAGPFLALALRAVAG